MRAVTVYELGSFDHAFLVEQPDPQPGPGEVVVEVHAVPVNYVDLVTMSGKYQFAPPLPYTPGKGPAGVVCAIGPDVTTVDVGDRVLAMAERGGYAEMAVVDQRQVYRLPDSLSFIDAASMSLAFDTAWMALRERARMTRGDTVFVTGATGAVGGAAVQLAKAMGASLVLAGVSAPARASAAIAAGADAIVDLSSADLRDSIRDQVLAVTSGAGVDIVIDPLGGDVFDGAIRAMAWRGRMVVIGFAAGRIPTLKVNYLMVKNIEVSGLQISDYRKRAPEMVAECYREVFDLHTQGKIAPLPSTTFPLEEWQQALEMIQGRKAPSRLVLLPREAGDLMPDEVL
jgi:NADPH2:quinone reductase